MLPAATVGRIASVSLEAAVAVSVVDTNDCDRYGLVPAFLEVIELFQQVRFDSVDLLDHRLGEDFDLGTDLDCRYCASTHAHARIENCRRAGNDLAKASVPTPRDDTPS